MSHTPGPWEVNDRWDIIGNLKVYTPLVASTVEAHFCNYPSVALHRDAVLANARLIAAAPDLLAACKEAYCILADIDDMPEVPSPWKRMLKAAIAKAEGQS